MAASMIGDRFRADDGTVWTVRQVDSVWHSGRHEQVYVWVLTHGDFTLRLTDADEDEWNALTRLEQAS